MLDKELKNSSEWQIESDFNTFAKFIENQPVSSLSGGTTGFAPQDGAAAVASENEVHKNGSFPKWCWVFMVLVVVVIGIYVVMMGPSAKMKKIKNLYYQGAYVEAYDLAQEVPSYRTKYSDQYRTIQIKCAEIFYDNFDYNRSMSVFREMTPVPVKLQLLREMCEAHLTGVKPSMCVALANRINYKDAEALFYKNEDAYMEGYFEGPWGWVSDSDRGVMRFYKEGDSMWVEGLIDSPGNGTYHIDTGVVRYHPSGKSEFVLHTITIESYDEMIWDSYTGERYHLYR